MFIKSKFYHSFGEYGEYGAGVCACTNAACKRADTFFSVPIIQAPKILDNAEPVVEKEIKKTVLTGPPVPVSQQELEEQYIETKAEQEKYKIYEPQKNNS